MISNFSISGLVKTLLLSFIIVTASCFSFAQKLDKKSITKNIATAEEAFFNQNYRLAINSYLALDSLVDARDKGYVNYQLGVCYLYSNIDNAKALEHLKTAESSMKESEIADIYLYHLARAYHLNEEFDNALNTYKKLEELDLYSQDLRQEVETYKEIAQNAKNESAKKTSQKIYNGGLEINSTYPDYKPVISADESTLIFTSRREHSGNKKKDLDGKFFEDIFIITKDDYGFWTAPVPIPGKVNSASHEASVGLSPDGSELLIYRGNPDAGGLYVSGSNGGEWSEPILLDGGTAAINAKKSWETSASMTADRQTVYFTSNRKGGQGGLDLYRSTKGADGKWGKPESLGPGINTKFDEESPFIHPDGKTLYFSSKGHHSMGGYDVFKTTLENGSWTNPVSMGYPVNSAADDIHFTITADGRKAYFSSSRKGSIGEQDIYLAILDEKVAPFILVRGVVKSDDQTKLSVKIRVVDKADGTVQKHIQNPDPNTGKYLMILPPGRSYEMIVSAEGYDPHVVGVTMPNQDKFHEVYQEIILSKLTAFGKKIGQEITVVNSFNDVRDDKELSAKMGKQADPEHLRSLVESVVAEAERTGSSLDNPSSPLLAAGLDKITKVTDAPVDQIAVLREEKKYTEAASGAYYYTDAGGKPKMKTMKVGDESILVIPSDAMAAADLSKPTDRVVDEQDLAVVATGKTTNYVLPAGKLDEDVAKSLNLQRTELNGQQVYLVSSELADLSKVGDQSLAAADVKPKEKPSDASGKGKIVGETIAMTQPITEKVADAVAKTPELLAEKIVTFDFNTFVLSDQFKAELAELIELMKKNPSYKLEVEGHTDSKGSDEYNLRLSKQRAQAVANYITAQGIKRDRIKVAGRGEERPIAPNNNPDGTDNETGRARNRRTEVRLKG